MIDTASRATATGRFATAQLPSTMNRPRRCPPTPLPLLAAVLAVLPGVAAAQEGAPAQSVAGDWIDVTLVAVRGDFARPPVHARNLFHVSAAMYDAWAAFDPDAGFVHLAGTGPGCTFDEDERASLATLDEPEAARERAVAAAAHLVLSARFAGSPGAAAAQANFDALAERHDVGGDAASVLGRRIAACTLQSTREDGANEANDYANRDYEPVNPPLDPRGTGNLNLADPDRWQPLSFDDFIDQSGNRAEATSFIGANWAEVAAFALGDEDAATVTRDGRELVTWLDPGPPPRSDDADGGALWADQHALTVRWSAHLDPRDGIMIDLSPGHRGAAADLATLLDADARTRLDAYDATDGGTEAAGLQRNPVTGQPYAPNVVPRGDWTRVIAEYWADGPTSETPPGHWFGLYREHVATHPLLQRRLAGTGPELDPLAFDVIAHLALGGALHDAAIAAWSTKGAYDSGRPISAVRWMAGLGQRSDTAAPNYHPDGLPLVPGRIETIRPGDPLAGPLDRNVGRLKGYVWRGPLFVRNPDTDLAGVGWILLENWWPYQRANFVTPPFAGYVSGHSTFSRAAATVLEELTGDAFFPGGLASFTAPADDFLVFERGPSVDVTLQWATYRDAADESGLSRIWGGIHPPADDVPGRALGEQVGQRAWRKALALSAGDQPGSGDGTGSGGGDSRGGGGCSIATANGEPGSVLLAMLLGALIGGGRRCALERIRHAVRRHRPDVG